MGLGKGVSTEEIPSWPSASMWEGVACIEMLVYCCVSTGTPRKCQLVKCAPSRNCTECTAAKKENLRLRSGLGSAMGGSVVTDAQIEREVLVGKLEGGLWSEKDVWVSTTLAAQGWQTRWESRISWRHLCAVLQS